MLFILTLLGISIIYCLIIWYLSYDRIYVVELELKSGESHTFIYDGRSEDLQEMLESPKTICFIPKNQKITINTKNIKNYKITEVL